MKRARAFTLVELLVVIAIISLLIGILLPAVNGARESGRRLTCKNNLRQQALGLRSYAQQFTESLPAIWQNGNIQPWENYAWRVALLPFVEESGRFDNLDQSLPPTDSANAPLTGTLPIFSCPSSPSSPRIIRKLGPLEGLMLGSTDYVSVFDVRGATMPAVQSGAWFGAKSPEALPGDALLVEGDLAPTAAVHPDLYSAEIRKIPPSLRRVRDGLSNTVLLVEQAGKPEKRNSLEEPMETELPSEGAWVTSEYASFFAASVNQDNHSGPYGFHSGATVAMCDGSVHFWPRTIATHVMTALLTREGSEIVNTKDW